MTMQLIRLKLQVTWNTMRGQTAILVLSILGVLYGLFWLALAAVGIGVAGAAGYGLQVAQIAVVGGAVLTVGWILVPVLFSSMDNTLDPRRLAPFVSPSRKLAFAMVVATGAGIAGIVTTLVALMPAIGMATAAHFAAAAVAVVSALLGMFCCFTWARVVSTWIGVRLTATSGRRDIMTVISTVLFIGVMASAGVWMPMIIEDVTSSSAAAISTIAGWTPFGAPWAIARWAYEGQWLLAAAALAITVAWGALGLWLWQKVLGPAMRGSANPVPAAVDTAIAEGRNLVDPAKGAPDAAEAITSPSMMRWLPGVERWQSFGMSPAASAIAQRTFVYWIKDPRLSTQLLACLIMPILAVVMTRIPMRFEHDASDPASAAAATASMSIMGWVLVGLCPLMMGMVVGALAQYDSTALWVEVAAGVRGRDDRSGRVMGSLPAVAVSLVLALGIYLAFARPGVKMGALLAVLCVLLFCASLAAALVLGSRWVYPVQPPGTSPMSTKGTGQFMATMVLQMGGWLAAAILMIPALGPLLWMYFAPPGGTIWAFPVASVWAIVWGVLLVVFAVRIGGRWWDRYSVQILTKIRAWPGH